MKVILIYLGVTLRAALSTISFVSFENETKGCRFNR